MIIGFKIFECKFGPFSATCRCGHNIELHEDNILILTPAVVGRHFGQWCCCYYYCLIAMMMCVLFLWSREK